MPTNGGNILVIDEDEARRSALKEILRAAGYRVFTVDDGTEGRRWLLTLGQPKAILIDEASVGLKEFFAKAKVPVVVTAGLESPFDEKRLLALVEEACATSP
ncbi:MAG: hypothetical protein HY075_14130 [Deltaproteobacteria bacterium]|nr:hypothetical protein [Deltaproteobacteria bacterium]